MGSTGVTGATRTKGTAGAAGKDRAAGAGAAAGTRRQGTARQRRCVRHRGVGTVGGGGLFVEKIEGHQQLVQDGW